MIRWLIVIPFALILAIAAGTVVFAFASALDPVLGPLVGDVLWVGLNALVERILSVDDPTPYVEGALSGASRLAFAILGAPALVSALVLEIAGSRRFVAHAGLTGLVSAAVPFLLRGGGRGPSPEEIHIAIVLGIVGAAAGAVYWMIAGRTAGRQREAARIFSAKAENRPAKE